MTWLRICRTSPPAISSRCVVPDVAAIDCVTMAYVRDALPDLAREVRTLSYSRRAPGLPLIASRQVPVDTIEALRRALWLSAPTANSTSRPASTA